MTDQTPGSAVALRASMEYANALAGSNLLPTSFRRQPANVLWAIEYGKTLNLTTMAAITGVHVIEGKPSASAGLISALVRRAGHRLRVRGDASTATVTIIRSDDPDYEFTVTWTLDDARTAGLLSKGVWRQYPASMLKSRAISQCARDACEEVLFGMHYTPEELGADAADEDGMPADVEVQPFPEPRDPRARPAADGVVWHVGSEQPAEEIPEQKAARECGAGVLARGAADSADLEMLRRTHRDAGPELRDTVIPDGVLTAGELAVAAVPDEPVTLGAWLSACGEHVKRDGTALAEAAKAGEGDLREPEQPVDDAEVVEGELVSS